MIVLGLFECEQRRRRHERDRTPPSFVSTATAAECYHAANDFLGMIGRQGLPRVGETDPKADHGPVNFAKKPYEGLGGGWFTPYVGKFADCVKPATYTLPLVSTARPKISSQLLPPK